jgi:hypothetical protein
MLFLLCWGIPALDALIMVKFVLKRCNSQCGVTIFHCAAVCVLRFRPSVILDALYALRCFICMLCSLKIYETGSLHERSYYFIVVICVIQRYSCQFEFSELV